MSPCPDGLVRLLSVCMLSVRLPVPPVTPCACVTEPGQRTHLHHLLPPVPGDAVGQAAEQGGGDQNPAVDLHQVVSGERRGGWGSIHGAPLGMLDYGRKILIMIVLVNIEIMII